MSKRHRWIMEQVERGIVRVDYPPRWNIMRRGEYMAGATRQPSLREAESLLSGRLCFLEWDDVCCVNRVRLTPNGKWYLKQFCNNT